jgi:putative spermidine/putrescine transport system substrate-binding protein
MSGCRAVRRQSRRQWLVNAGRFGAAAWLSGCTRPAPKPELTDTTSWEEIEAAARGGAVRLHMWDGDPLVNAYMRDYVTPQLRDQHGVELQLIGGQAEGLVSKLMVDLEARRAVGDIDLAWINGQAFYQLRSMQALYGPFTQRLPNNRCIDWDNPFVSKDFQQAVEGYECPWGNVQLALIYNSEVVAKPPRNRDTLSDWVKKHPGRFTFDNGFTGMTFLKSLLYDFAGGPRSLDGPFDEAVYLSATAQLWDYLRDMQPSLWRSGETFPDGVAQLHQLFSNREVDFTMSNNDGEVDNKVLQGVLPESARAYVLETGTIRNSHYLGIPVNAPNKAAAMVLANFLISPEAQLKKAAPAVWGDGSVLSLSLLPDEWRTKFENIEGRIRVPSRSELEQAALPEPPAELMVRLHDDFRSQIIERPA